MAFESSDKSGLNNGRKVRLDISNINQSSLKGERAATDEQLLQLIIDNLAGVEIPAGTTDVNNDGKIDVNDLIFSVSEAYKRYAKTQSNKVTLPNLIESLTKGIAVLHNDLAIQQKISQGLEAQLLEQKKKAVGEPNPRIYSSGTVEQNKLHPVEKIVQAVEAKVVSNEKIIGNTTDIAKSISAQIPDINKPLTEYSGPLVHGASNLADTIKNMWTVIGDLKNTVSILLEETGNTLKVGRMGDIYTFFLSRNTCDNLIANAQSIDGAGGNARDLWNETGVLYDPSVPAFTSNVPSVSSECLNGAWYCVTGSKGGNTLAQYSRTAPFWKNIGSVCPAPKKTYNDPSTLEL